MSEQAQPQFALQRIYIKDLSFESPNSPAAFTKQWKPDIQFDLNTSAKQIDQTHYEVVIKSTITAKNEDETAFLIEIEQAGLFAMANIPEQQMGPMLGAMCPNIVFPYLRETVDSIVIKGGFPPLMLSPINFDALYQKRQQELAAEKQAAAEKEETTH